MGTQVSDTGQTDTHLLVMPGQPFSLGVHSHIGKLLLGGMLVQLVDVEIKSPADWVVSLPGMC